MDPESVAKLLQDAWGTACDDAGDYRVCNPFLMAGATLDPKIKAKIPRGDNGPGLQMSYSNASITQLSLQPARSRQIPSFGEWLKCFGVYMAVYLARHPQRGPELVSYMLCIQALAEESPSSFAWRGYDEAFRRIRAFSPQLPWHLTNYQLLADVNAAAAAD